MSLQYPLDLFSTTVDTSSMDDVKYDPSNVLTQARKEVESRYRNYSASRPPDEEDWAIPHHLTFSAVWNWHLKYYYSYFDESQIDSIENSLAMRRDGFVQELLWHRQLPTVSLPFSLECDDPDDPGQVKIRKELHKVVNKIPYFQRLKLQLLEALFYGKSGSQIVWGKKRIGPKVYNTIVAHKPVNGDKITYSWDDIPAIFIYKSAKFEDQYIQKYIEYRDRGPALVLRDEYYRDRFIIHEFQPSDTDYLFESDKAAAVHGIGFRDRFYVTWNMRAQVLAWYLNSLERVGVNGMLYAYYPSGNNQAKNAVMKALKDFISTNVAAFPRSPGDKSSLIERIDPSNVGYDVLYQLLSHLEEIMRRGWLGQNLSSQSSSTGLGSGVAALQGESKEDTILYDSSCLAETLDEQAISRIIYQNEWEYNGKKYRGEDLPFSIRLTFQSDRQNVAGLIQAANSLWQMGVPLDMEDLRDRTGLAAPRSKATTLVQMDGGGPGKTPNKDAVDSEVGPGSSRQMGQEKPSEPPKKREGAEQFAADNCGTGAGGFKSGNTCAKGDGDSPPSTIRDQFEISKGPNGYDLISEDDMKFVSKYSEKAKSAIKKAGFNIPYHKIKLQNNPDSEIVAYTSNDTVNVNIPKFTNLQKFFDDNNHYIKNGEWPPFMIGDESDIIIHEIGHLINRKIDKEDFKRLIDEFDIALHDDDLPSANAQENDSEAFAESFVALVHGYKSFNGRFSRFINGLVKKYLNKEDIEKFSANPCGDGGSSPGFQKGNTCAAGEGSSTPTAKAKKSPKTEAELVDAVESSLLRPSEDSNVEKLLHKINSTPLLSVKAAVSIIGSKKPEHLGDVERFLSSQHNKLISGKVRPRDLAKAVMITIASQGSGAREVDVIRNSLGKDSDFIKWLDESDEGKWFQSVATTLNASGKPSIRPEDIAGGWFLTENGRKALDNIDSNKFNPDDWTEYVAIRKAFGDDRVNTTNILGSRESKTKKLSLSDIYESTNDINLAKGDPDKIEQTLLKFKGIGLGKKGFVKHFLGLTDSPTIDAVQVNFWLTGVGDVRRLKSEQAELAREIKNHISNPRVAEALTTRINKRMSDLSQYMEKNFKEKTNQHIMHHWLWDAAKGLVSKHLGMYTGYSLGEAHDAPEFFQSPLDPHDPGIMIALMVPNPQTSPFLGYSENGLDDPHITLCYLGRLSEVGEDAVERAKMACKMIASANDPVKATAGGIGVFPPSKSSDNKSVIYCPVDSAEIHDLRDDLVIVLEMMEIPYKTNHGFTPHITLQYTNEEVYVDSIPSTKLVFPSLSVVVGGSRTDFQFKN